MSDSLQDLLDSYDPDDDLDTALEFSDEEKAVLSPPPVKPAPNPDDLEAIAQQVARRLGRGIPGYALKRREEALGALLAEADDMLGGKTVGNRRYAGRNKGSQNVQGFWSGYIFEAPDVRLQMQTGIQGRSEAVLLPTGEVATVHPVTKKISRRERPVGPASVNPMKQDPAVAVVSRAIIGKPVAVAKKMAAKKGLHLMAGTRIQIFMPRAVNVRVKNGVIVAAWGDGDTPLKTGAPQVGSANAPKALESEPKGLLDVFDPRHNLREIAKELLLLEDHLAQPAKHCHDCIKKHMLRAEALAEEAVQLDRDGALTQRLLPLPGQIRNLQREFLADTDRNTLQQQVRELRKALSKESFDALAFKVSGAPNRTPVVFAMERGKADVQLGAEADTKKPVAAESFPATVNAALKRRVESGLEQNPAPILFRVRNADGTTTVSEGMAIGMKGEGDLLVQVVGPTARTVAVPVSDAVLDLSKDPTFLSIPWPATLPLTRVSSKGTRVEVFALPQSGSKWMNVRVIASTLWPVVDGYALSKAGPPTDGNAQGDARQTILQRILVAAIVNAIYESGLNADIEADQGKDVGLFQLRDENGKGAGAGMSKAARKDPFLNTARIGQRFLETKKFFDGLATDETAMPGSTPPSAWTEIFTRAVEAPADKDTAGRVRADTTAAAFVRGAPLVVRQPLAPVEEASTRSFSPVPWLFGGVAFVAAAVGIGTAVMRSNRVA